MKRLQDMHDSEINFTIESFFDGAVTCKIGDEMNGHTSEFLMDTIEGAVSELCKEVVKVYPDSKFAKNYGIPGTLTKCDCCEVVLKDKEVRERCGLCCYGEMKEI